jgi:alcohol dehydrogenase
MKAWRDGTLAEFALAPVAAISLVEDEAIPVDRLGTLGKLAVPAGGLLRGRLAPGETLVVIGASGSSGSAAVLLGCALGAEKVVAVGRNEAPLHHVARVAGPRVRPPNAFAFARKCIDT